MALKHHKAWADPVVRKKRTTRHKVRVDGAIFQSVRAAFWDLELPMEHHQKFRGQLKEHGALVYEYRGHRYVFELVER